MGNINKSTRNAGFSLIELIIAIAIMGVLVGVVAPQYLKYVEKSKRVVDVTTAKEVAEAFDRVFAIEDVSTRVGSMYVTMTGWDKTTQMKDLGSSSSFLDYVFHDLGQVPKSATFKEYFWEVDFDGHTGSVVKVVLYDKKGNKSYELYPNSDDFLDF